MLPYSRSFSSVIVEAVVESPKVIEESLPEQLKGAFGQAVNTAQQLPVPIKDAISTGFRIPLNNERYCRNT